MNLKLYKYWWLLTLKAGLIAGLGLFMFLIREISLNNFTTVCGIVIGLGGLFIITGSLIHRKYNCEWTWWLIEGLFDIFIASLLLFYPIASVSVAFILIGIWAILMGLFQFATAINIQYYMPGNSVFMLSAIISLIGGVLILSDPGTGLKGLQWLFGIYVFLYGSIQFYISLRLRRIVIEEIGNIEDVYL